MAKDRFHEVVKTAIEKEGWQITADPYEIKVHGVDFAINLSDRKMAVEHYRQLIQQLLSERAERSNSQSLWPEYEVQTLFDTERDHYQLLHIGWRDTERAFGCIMHLDIKDGQIWIQHDATEVGIANQLVELGVPKQDIVLAFHEPQVRQFTDFGTGKTTSSVI